MPPPNTHLQLSDWITAISTAATAIAATFAGIIAWLSLRRAARAPLPIFEPRFHWSTSEPTIGLLQLSLVIRNHLDEAIVVDSVTVKRPRGMTVCSMKYNGYGGAEIKITTDRSSNLGWGVGPPGDYASQAFGGPQRKDVAYQNLYFSVPEGWTGGKAIVVFRVSSMALTIRDKRITITRQVPVAPKTQTEAKASSAD